MNPLDRTGSARVKEKKEKKEYVAKEKDDPSCWFTSGARWVSWIPPLLKESPVTVAICQSFFECAPQGKRSKGKNNGLSFWMGGTITHIFLLAGPTHTSLKII
jgi:hypothetical protein